VLSQLRTEQRLIDAGLEARLAVRLAPWLAPRIDVTRTELDADALRALDGPTLHALSITLAALTSIDPRFGVRAIAVQRELTFGVGAGYLADLVERAAIPTSRRAAIPARLASRAIDAIAREDGPRSLASLREVGAGDDVFAEAARAAIAARVARAHHFLEALLAEVAVLGAEEAPARFMDACSEDARLGGERELRRRMITAWLGIAWPIYTERRWDLLRRLLASIQDVACPLAIELEADPTELAYRASVAQVLVFRSEMASTLTDQIRLGERAHALCPTLRNGRVVLAAHLAHRAASETNRAKRDRDAHRALALDPYQRRAREILGRQ